MATGSGLYVTGWSEVQDGTIDIDTDELKLMLVDSSYVYNRSHDVIDNAANNTTDPSYCELSVTNYAGGHGGAGRKTATVSIVANKTDGTVDFHFSDSTWASLGGVSNGTVGGMILVKENANDAAGRLIAFFGVTNTPTNGGDITIGFASTKGISLPVA